MLCDREPKIVNGPELLNAYVGQSEENVRNLFADAKREYAEVRALNLSHGNLAPSIDPQCFALETAVHCMRSSLRRLES